MLLACLNAAPESIAYSDVPAYAEQISAQQAAQSARSASGGRVLSVRLAGSAYHVKLLIREGVVRVVRVDARSGQVLR